MLGHTGYGIRNATALELLRGLTRRQFATLVGQLRREGAELRLTGRPWKLAFEDRVLLVAVYWRTNLTMRQVETLFGTSKSATARIIDHLAPIALRANRFPVRATVGVWPRFPLVRPDSWSERPPAWSPNKITAPSAAALSRRAG